MVSGNTTHFTAGVANFHKNSPCGFRRKQKQWNRKEMTYSPFEMHFRGKKNSHFAIDLMANGFNT